MTTADLVARLEELHAKASSGDWTAYSEFIAFCANHALPLVRELRNENEQWRSQWRSLNTHWLGIGEEYSTEQAIEELQIAKREAEQENERLRAELAEAKRDAERYRWIRKHAVVETWGTGRRPLVRLQFDAYANSMDEAIDERIASLAQSQPKDGEKA